MFLFLTSCATRGIIPDAISKGETISINVETKGDTYVSFYELVIQKNGEEYELMQLEHYNTITYKLPSNKLELLSEMEPNFKGLNSLGNKYFVVTISTALNKKIYKINTDVVHDFITGLKKK